MVLPGTSPNHGVQATSSSVRCAPASGRCACRALIMIDIASVCATRTEKSDFWCNRCVTHPYFLMCTRGTSEGLAAYGETLHVRHEGGCP